MESTRLRKTELRKRPVIRTLTRPGGSIKVRYVISSHDVCLAVCGTAPCLNSLTWKVLAEAGVQLNDQDFLSILEEDPQIVEGAMIFANISSLALGKLPEEQPQMLQEKQTSGQDFIFLQNFKMPLLDLAKELHVFKPRSVEEAERVTAVDIGVPADEGATGLVEQHSSLPVGPHSETNLIEKATSQTDSEGVALPETLAENENMDNGDDEKIPDQQSLGENSADLEAADAVENLGNFF